MKVGDISKRVALRNKLGCKNFRWYLEKILPESVMIVGSKAIGQIQLLNTKYCLDKLGRINNRQIGIYTCHGNGYSQGFSYQRNGQIVAHYTDCLDIAKKEDFTEEAFESNERNDPNALSPHTNTTNHVVLNTCGPHNGTKWHYDEKVNERFVQFLVANLLSNFCDLFIRQIKSNISRVASACQRKDGWRLWRLAK